jgi:hypothetical protein
MVREHVSWGIVWLIIGGVGLPGCATKQDRTSDETHFLCTVDSDCTKAGAAYRCESGVCQVPVKGSGITPDGPDTGHVVIVTRDADLPDTGPAMVRPLTGEQAICALIEATSGDVDASAVNAALGDAADICAVQASKYDRSCTKDADCIEVGEGNACTLPCVVACANTAISASAESAYQADIAKTPLGFCTPAILCGCPSVGSAVCLHGTCELRPIGATVDSGGNFTDSGRPLP